LPWTSAIRQSIAKDMTHGHEVENVVANFMIRPKKIIRSHG